ncbi:MAG TPA: histidinol-phosphate transaminase [Steroidobacteraceae bacterium]|nr:histidinol-phosphate transaminase [Steroidobacteraceae bacterium]
MRADSRAVAVDPISFTPRLTRRAALLGAAAFLAPIPTSVLAAARKDPAHKSGLIRLDSNENPYGPSPAARQAILASAGEAPRYADATIESLTKELATHEGVAASQIVIGTGSGELLRMAGLLAMTSAPGSELVASRPTYEELPQFAEKMGLKVQWVAPDAAHRHDLPAMRAAITELTRLVYVCNPNNPTGTAVTREALESFIRTVPAQCTVIVDEAYMDLVDQPGVGTVAGLVKDVPNVIVLHTFSKIHGLAGLRVGYSISPVALAQRFAALTLTWPNSTGISAATASFNDHAFLNTTRAALVGDRARVHATLDRMGLRRSAAQGNFVFFDTGAPLKRFQDGMLAAGIKVGRHFDGYDTWARVTIGVHREVDQFLGALPHALV